MSYTIKDRYGATLHVAKNAADVRAALQDGVSKGANLYGADLYGADLCGANLRSANLRSANLRSANLCSANLYGANLYGADLRSANLYGANLYGADLRSANLYGADLYGADLCGARGVQPEATSPLHILSDQVGKIRAYKLVTAGGYGPVKGGVHYEKGKTVEAPDAVTDITVECGAGINVATLDWCMREWRSGYRILVVEFTAKDIAAIPTATDGKFRLFKCKVVGEKDLVALGLVSA